jgi:peptidoglycan DL-endopeptidase CwlO
MLVTGNAATGGPVGGRTATMKSSRTRQARVTLLILAALSATLGVGVTAAGADPTIDAKRAQAVAIENQVQVIYSRVEKAAEAYNLANLELAKIDSDLRTNAKHLKVAKQSLGVAQTRVADRLRSLYIDGDNAGAVEIILGARSLDDIITRLDVAERVGAQDAAVLKNVRKFRREVRERRERLTKARARQADLVAEKAAQKRYADGQLADAQELLASVKDQIRQLQVEQRRRDALLAAQARARLAAQQQESQQATLAAADAGIEVASQDGSETVNLPDSKYTGVVGIAMQYLGVPYVWGGASPAGFDCSGFIMYVFAQVGVSLPHHAASQYSYGVPVPRDQLQPGDLVFFDGLGHAGIYIGGNQFIHAPHTGDVVKISAMEGWYDSGYVGARRLL